MRAQATVIGGVESVEWAGTLSLRFWAVVLLALAGAARPGVTATWYVRPLGNDVLCNGTANLNNTAGNRPNCAFATVARAVSVAASGDTVSLQSAAYAESVTVDKALTINKSTGAGLPSLTGFTFTANPVSVANVVVPTIDVSGAGRIQDAVSAVTDAGTVNVAAGAYGEAVTIGKQLTVTGSGSPSTTSFTLSQQPVAITGFDVATVNVAGFGGGWGSIADAVAAVNASGAVTVAGPHAYGESVTISKPLALTGSGTPQTAELALDNTPIAVSGINVATIDVTANGSVQDGVDAAKPTGTTINVAGASYAEDVTIGGKTVKLVGTGSTEVNSFTLTDLGSADGSSGITAPNTYVNALGAGGGSIDGGVKLVDVGGTVHVAAGTYSGGVTITKRLTLQGVGSGHTGSDTVIVPGGGALIDIRAGGVSGTPLLIQDLGLYGAGESVPAIQFGGAATSLVVEYVTIRNVIADNLSAGVRILTDGTVAKTVNHLILDSCSLTNHANHGVTIDTNIDMDDLQILDCTMTGNGFAELRVHPVPGTVKNLTLTGGTYTGTMAVSSAANIRLDGNLDTATLSGFTAGGDPANPAVRVAADTVAGTPDVTTTTQHVTISGATVQGSGDSGIVLLAQNGSTLQDVKVQGGTISGNLNGVEVSVPGSGTTSGIVVSGAAITGNTAAGVLITRAADVSVTGNDLSGNAAGVELTGVLRSGVAAHCNRIVGNSSLGVDNRTAGTLDAEDNWWGCNFGPGATGTGCSAAANGVSGSVDADPWLTLRGTPALSSIAVAASTTVTADLTWDSASAQVSSCHVPDGITVGYTPSLGSLSGTTSTSTTNGTASTGFTAGTAPGAGGVTVSADSQTALAAIEIVAGAATHLVFTTQPTNTAAGATMSSVVVSAEDGYGNVDANYAGNVTVAIGTNPGGGTLSGTKTVTASSGVAQFSDLSIDKAGTGYTLAASGSVTGDTSAAFNITAGSTATLVFTTQPTNTIAGSTMSPVVVSAEDSHGNVDTTFAGNVTVAIGTNPGSGALSGTKTVTASLGVAQFTDLSIEKAGTGYTLVASGSVTGDTSTAFDITAGVATHLVFAVQPSNAAAGNAISPAVVVSAEDSHGNVDTTFAGNVTVAIGTNPGSGTLSGTKSVTASLGVAQFADLSIDKAGTGYTLAATGSVPGDTSAAFDISTGSPAHIAVSAGSGQRAKVNQAFATDLRARVTDKDGNPVSGVTVTFTAPGSGASGTFAGFGASATATTDGQGVATAPQLTANGTVGPYQVAATATGAASPAMFDLSNESGTAIPALGGAGLAALAALLAAAGALALGRRTA